MYILWAAASGKLSYLRLFFSKKRDRQSVTDDVICGHRLPSPAVGAVVSLGLCFSTYKMEASKLTLLALKVIHSFNKHLF